MSALQETLRKAVAASSESLNGIARGSGVSAGQLSRMLHRERQMTTETLERLAEYLDLEIIVRARKKKAARK